MNREKFAISCSVVNAIRVIASAYQFKGEEQEYSEEELKEMAESVKSQCSQMMIDDLAVFISYCIEQDYPGVELNKPIKE